MYLECRQLKPISNHEQATDVTNGNQSRQPVHTFVHKERQVKPVRKHEQMHNVLTQFVLVLLDLVVTDNVLGFCSCRPTFGLTHGLCFLIPQVR